MDDDQLHFGFADVAYHATQLEPTKWNVVNFVGYFYYSLGFLSLTIICFKISFGSCGKRGHEWDQLLLPDLLPKRKELIEELEQCPVISLHRCIWIGSPTEDVCCSLHGFCDASKHSYTEVVYLVFEFS